MDAALRTPPRCERAEGSRSRSQVASRRTTVPPCRPLPGRGSPRSSRRPRGVRPREEIGDCPAAARTRSRWTGRRPWAPRTARLAQGGVGNRPRSSCAARPDSRAGRASRQDARRQRSVVGGTRRGSSCDECQPESVERPWVSRRSLVGRCPPPVDCDGAGVQAFGRVGRRCP